MIDADLGLANLDIMLGVHAGATLDQVLDGAASVQEAVLGIEPNLWLIPASAGLMSVREVKPETREGFLRMLESLPWDMDVILVDVGAGIQPNVLSIHHPSFESVIVLNPQPTSLTDAYSLLKILRSRVGISRANVIVNQVTDGRVAQQTFAKLRDVAVKFSDIQLEYMGHWQFDEKITQAVMKRKILLDLDETSSSLTSLGLLAKRFREKWRLGESGFAPEKKLEKSDTFGLKWDHELGCFSGAGLSSATRYEDEMAQWAPGNTAGFWRTLLGEVNV
jgi:flagellar biosynthesis protein FlhG